MPIGRAPFCVAVCFLLSTILLAATTPEPTPTNRDRTQGLKTADGFISDRVR